MDKAVAYTQSSSKDEAFENAKSQITEEYIAKFNVKADISYDKDAGKIHATGKGFELTLEFTDSETQITAKMGMLLKPFKGKVIETIERKLTKYV
ncbi:MAG: hypothetical protein EP326_06890 [Deltaproteobacteria bacterium]|jgi:hypothetical protein|nr:MAG: hypothetical protein EP326_06890 [Deltaproteobacteria bacterium]TNF31445.1 MAG: hypothetical protein EP319_02165 [Deltaproteobacteria bacterium]